MSHTFKFKPFKLKFTREKKTLDEIHKDTIDKFDENDERYYMLNKINRPIKLNSNTVMVRMINYSNYKPSGYVIKYIFNERTINAIIQFIIRENDGNDFYYDMISSVNYLFNIKIIFFN